MQIRSALAESAHEALLLSALQDNSRALFYIHQTRQQWRKPMVNIVTRLLQGTPHGVTSRALAFVLWMTVSNSVDFVELMLALDVVRRGLDPDSVGDQIDWRHVDRVNQHVIRLSRKRARDG